jgi:HEAT repeat protein
MKTQMAFVLLVSVLLMGKAIYAQPQISRDKIPSGIPKEVRDQILQLYSPEPALRAFGALELGRLGKRAEPALPFLLELLADGTQLGTVAFPFPVEYLLETVSHAAAVALGKIGKSAVDPLIARLGHEDWHVRYAAAWSLEMIRDARAVEPLINTLKDKDSDVRFRCTVALEKITAKDFGEDPVKWREWWEKNKKAFQKGR